MRKRCLNSYTSENLMIKPKQQGSHEEKTSIRTSPESQIYWKNHLHKSPLHFRIYADFEADNETDNSSIGNKTTIFYKQNPICNGYERLPALEDVLKSDYFKSPLGYENVDWFVDEIIKLENKMTFYFNNTKKDIVLTREDLEDFENCNICRFCGKNMEFDKVRDHCHLTGK